MHYPVMLQNVLKALSTVTLRRKIQVADCNFGLGGHTNAILSAIPNSHITAFQLDPNMIKKYKQTPQLHKRDQSRLIIVNNNFTSLIQVEKKYDVILADLGFNSLQLEQSEGFSWNLNSPLDMRYSKDASQSCQMLIKRLSFIEILDILVKYGDLSTTEAKIAAKAIQETKPKTTFQLRDCVVGCFQSNKTKKIAQVFQAFRIAVNKELECLKTLCGGLEKIMNKNALALFITFHSLERDIVYRVIKQKQKEFTKIKSELPSKKQLEENIRSRSAQMLVFKKI